MGGRFDRLGVCRLEKYGLEDENDDKDEEG